MAKALATQIKAQVSSIVTDSEGMVQKKGTISVQLSNTLETVATDLNFTVTGTISSSTFEIDLSAALEDPIGDPAIFTKVMMILIRNNGTNPMTVGGANNIPLFADASDRLNLAGSASGEKNPYVLYVDENGITVTAGTGDKITITGTDGDTVDIAIVGVSA